MTGEFAEDRDQIRVITGGKTYVPNGGFLTLVLDFDAGKLLQRDETGAFHMHPTIKVVREKVMK